MEVAMACALHRAALMKKRARLPARAFAIVGLPIAISACLTDVESEPELDEIEEPLASSVSGLGPDGGIDWSIDAPWRMEPTMLDGGQRAYDPIPITVTFHDADMQDPEHPVPMQRFCGVDVMELQPGQTWESSRLTRIAAQDFHEIEATLRWTAAGILTPTPAGQPAHVVRRIWNGDSPDGALAIGSWAEWHGTFTYQPQTTPAGNEVRLIVMARVSRHGGECSPLDLDRAELMFQLQHGKVSTYPPPPITIFEDLDSTFFGDFLRVGYGSDPLPRFDLRWVYGDVHYHSQGTDNEGESALNFRSALAAMKAMGLDYAFATDHTSGGTQVSGTGTVIIDNPPEVPWYLSWIPYLEDYVKEILAKIQVPMIERDALRDMNQEKFRNLRAWLNDPDGANAQVLSIGGSSRAPQLFLGGEVDVIPEVSDAEANQGYMSYGNGARYYFNRPCTAVLDILNVHSNWEEVCSSQMLTTGSAVGRKMIRDVQGTLDIGWFSRQHLVHLPTNPASDDQVIVGNTSSWGGATLSLKSLVEDHLGAQQKGYAFLAHPVDASEGSGALRLGPDMVPYSTAQLEVAFASPYILGLELWNGDNRVTSTAPEHRPSSVGGARHFPFLDKTGTAGSVSLDWSWEAATPYELHKQLWHGSAMWDQMNLWGITPARTAAIGLGAGVYRKVYMSGGSDAHGDLDYRRNGRVFGVYYATDTAIGSPRNLTFVGTERPGHVDDGGAGVPTVGQAQIVDALRSGRFSVTDGPALRIAIDRNGNNLIDDGDAQMGEDFTLTGTATAPLLVQWKSTSEFGPVRELDVYVGAQAGTRAGVVYAPQQHGPTGGASCIESESPILDPEGNEYCPMSDGYVRDQSLHVDVSTTAGVTGYAGTVRFDLDPRAFKLFDISCTTTTVPAPTDDGEPPAWEDIKNCRVDRTEVAPRLFVRAFAQTDDTIDSFAMHRYAYANPIWLHAPELPGAPTASLTYSSCWDEVNTFSATVAATGSVPATLYRESRIGNGSWTTLASSTISAPAGHVVWLRARACNGNGCSGYAQTSATGATSCPVPIPSPPKVMLEYTGCSSGTNSFAVTVGPLGSVPATSFVKQSKVASGAWTTLTGSKITAGSQQTVYLRAKACNANGCSSYATTSKTGPTCSGGGPLPQ